MKTENLITNFEKGNTHLLTASISNVEKQWEPHPKFKGVYLKHIITGGQTDIRFSSHIVKIDPNCILDVHIHEGKTELHEVIEGDGICYLNDTRVIYSPGDCAVIPDNIKHKVQAGENGLVLFAKFVPALL